MSCDQSPRMKRYAATMEACRNRQPEDRRRAMSHRRDVVRAKLPVLAAVKWTCPMTRHKFQTGH